MPTQTQGHSAILYGNSGIGKTTQLYYVAKRLHAETGKPVRCVSWEDSSRMIYAPLIQSGAMDYLSVVSSPDPLALLAELREGNWPTPDRKGWMQREKWAGEVSGYILEGLTTGCESVLEACRQGHRFLREQAKDAFETGGRKFTAASQTAYGFAQAELLVAVKQFSDLPVDFVLWSAHEAGGMDDDAGLIRGPALVGKAKTARVQAYVGAVLHLDRTPNGVYCFFKPHADPAMPGVTYPAKITLPPEVAAQLQAKYPDGRFPVRLERPDLADFLFTVRDAARGTQPVTANAA